MATTVPTCGLHCINCGTAVPMCGFHPINYGYTVPTCGLHCINCGTAVPTYGFHPINYGNYSTDMWAILYKYCYYATHTWVPYLPSMCGCHTW